jgi:DNA polymerase III delta prime subunit
LKDELKQYKRILIVIIIMNELNINKLLNRENEVIKIKEILKNFETNKHDLSIKKGIYVYGEPGTGKTTFVMDILKEMNYDVIRYDAGDIRNKMIIDTITKHNMADKNIMSIFHKKVKKIVIVMDEIDGMNNGDKGGINTLIKLIRPKKTKKQKMEEMSLNPIICIGNYHIDKKIKELMKVCNVIELKIPNITQMTSVVKTIMPNLSTNLNQIIIQFIQHDLRKLNTILGIYQNKPEILSPELFSNIFQIKSYNDDTKKITQKLINNPYSIDSHLTIMNETDRTIVGLLWHENIIDVLAKVNKEISIPFYLKSLENMCFADYIDRVTFQKQIWQFNEMSSLIKTFKNNKLYHETFKKKPKFNPVEIRFTKVLTKYSTEYNNSLFVQNLCQQLGMDQKDLFSFFLNLKNLYNNDNEIFALFENYEITKLDINRIYRYLENYIKETIADEEDDNELVSDEDTE